MRNLKKVLSLALAMVMLLGMMVVGAGAATSFKDADSIDDNRKVAAAVASAIEVLVGDENGNFNPDGTLTRAEAAVVLARLDLGASAASALTATDAATFDDIGAGSGYGWAKPFIDYCAGNGYMVGVGGNSFAPGRTLTGVEFATMVSRVLGYRDENEYGKDGWTAVKAAALARKAGLGTDVAVDSNKMSRADMAQMVLNALTASMVEYNGLNISGDLINVSSPASVRTHTGSLTSNNTTYDGEEIKSNITPIRLCEEKFPDLKFAASSVDAFGHICSAWTLKRVEIAGTKVTKEADVTITKKTGKDDVKALINDASGVTGEWNDVKTARVTVLVNGKAWDSGKVVDAASIADLTGNGRSVEVYFQKHSLKAIEKVVVMDTVLGEVSKVDADGKLTIKLVETKEETTVKSDIVTADAEVVDGEFKKGDLVLVQGHGTKTEKISKDTTVSAVFAPTKLEGFVNVKSYDKNGNAVSLTVDGEKYEDAKSVMAGMDVDKFEVNNKGFDSTLYLDQYNFIVKAIPGVDPNVVNDNLIAVSGVYQDYDATGRKIVDTVKGIRSNGMSIEMAYDKSACSPKAGFIYTYVYSDSTGLYTLTELKDQVLASETSRDKAVADKKSTDSALFYGASLNATYTFNSRDVVDYALSSNKTGDTPLYTKGLYYADTVKFIYANNGEVTVLNGRTNLKLEGVKMAQAVNADGEIVAVFVEQEPDIVDLNSIIFVHLKKSSDTVVDKKTTYWGYSAYNANGTEIEDFYGNKNDMSNEFFKADQVKSDEFTYYKDTKSKFVTEHTLTPTKISYANGTKGDSFTIGGVEYITSKSTNVKDLTKNGVIETPAELNEIINKDKREVTVALIYNTNSTANQGKGTKEVYTIFITEIGEPGSYKPEEKPEVEAGKLTIKDTDPTGIESCVWKTGDSLKAGDKIEVTVKSGYEAEAPAADATVVVDGLKYTFTVTEKGAKDGVTITIKKAAAGAVTVASTATDRYGAKLLTVKDGSGASLSPTAGTVMFYAQATAPEWVALTGDDIATGDITSVTYTIYLNGAPVTSETKAVTVSGASGRNFTLTGTTTAAVGFTGTPKIEITDVKYANAAVRYVLKDGNESGATPTLVDKKTGAAKVMSTGTAADVQIAYDDVKWGLADGAANASITVVGTKTGAGSPALAANITGTAASLVTNYSTSIYVVADGKGYVDIVIDGLEKKAPTYSFAVDGTTLTAGELFVAADGTAGSGVAINSFGTVDTGNASKKLILTVSKVAGIKGGDTVTITAKLDGALAAAADTDKFYNYEVQLKINGTWHKATLNGTTAVTVFAGSLTNSVELTKDDVKIVGLERIKATGASWAGNTLTITFDKTVEATSGDTVTNGSYTFTANATTTATRVAPAIANVVAEGTTVKVIFTAGSASAGKTNTDELEAGDVVVITLDKVANTAEGADAADKAAKTTITLEASGAAKVEVK